MTTMTQHHPDQPDLSHARDTPSPPTGRLSDGMRAPYPPLQLTDGPDLDGRFLLTPPATDSASRNPFDEVTIDAAIQPQSQLSQLLEQNAQAHRANAHANRSRPVSPYPTGEGPHVLNDLHLRTDMAEMRRTSSAGSTDSFSDYRLRTSTSQGSLPLRIPSVRRRLHSTAGSISPGSVISSPLIAAMLDITPLPSPTVEPAEWRAFAKSRSRASSTSSKHGTELGPPLIPTVSPRKKGYGALHAHRKSSLSGEIGQQDTRPGQYVSEPISTIATAVRQRNATPTGNHADEASERQTSSAGLHREHYLADKRGIASPFSEAAPSISLLDPFVSGLQTAASLPKRTKVEIWSAQSIHTGATKHYETIRLLGQGTFSKVYLAVRQMHDRKDSVDYRQPSTDMAGVRARSRRLVAVKVVEPGPAGGADAERIEISLKREVELMKQIKHPSIIHLKSFGTDSNARALLVMNYCPGGDLFELASKELHVLTSSLVRRIFAELVSAVRFLHQKYIVHRDIKLENVLLNIPAQVHRDVRNWQTIDRAVVTLTDLGLSRSIPPPPESPLLETRCGSEDYAAPEIIMGMPYDGRQTDAWALGVLLYSLMEGRLPFDPPPGARGDPATLRARTPHRIARCEWQWVRFGDEDGEWDAEKGKGLEGGMQCVDALLKRNTRRKPLAEIRDWAWVRDGIQVDGGLRWVEEEGM